MSPLDPAAFADLLAGYCLEVRAGRERARALDALAAPLLLELQRAILERDAWPLLRVELPGQTRVLLRARARPPPRRLPRPRARRGQEVDALARHPGARRRARARRRRPRAHRPLRARAPADPRGDDEEALVLDAVADRGAGRPGGHERSRTSPPSCAARCSSTSPTRCAAWGGLRAFQERADRPPARARELRLEAEGTDLTPQRRRPHVGQLRRQAQHAQRRGLHRPARAQRQRPRALHGAAPRRPGVDVDGVELELRDGEVVAARAARRRRVPAARAADRRRRAAASASSASARTSASTRPTGHDPLRREDRRHRPPRARALLSGDRRQEPLRAALGSHLRPARRRAAHAPTARSCSRTGASSLAGRPQPRRSSSCAGSVRRSVAASGGNRIGAAFVRGLDGQGGLSARMLWWSPTLGAFALPASASAKPWNCEARPRPRPRPPPAHPRSPRTPGRRSARRPRPGPDLLRAAARQRQRDVRAHDAQPRDRAPAPQTVTATGEIGSLSVGPPSGLPAPIPTATISVPGIGTSTSRRRCRRSPPPATRCSA